MKREWNGGVVGGIRFWRDISHLSALFLGWQFLSFFDNLLFFFRHASFLPF